ncbi:MAG: DegV family protein [Acetatifactor sp.]
MKLKKLFRRILDSDLDIQERLFRLLVTIGLSGLALAVIVGVFMGENPVNSLPLLLAFFVLLGITVLSIRWKKIQAGAVLISVLIVFFALPFNFLTSGAIYGGGSIWFMFGVIFVCLVVEGCLKYVLIACSILVQAGTYFFAYNYPQYVVPHSIETAYIDSFATLMIVTILICAMILFQNAIYLEENAKVKRQKSEIEELNQMQNRFFSSMSHEIRTPINTIIGLNEMILRQDVSEEVAADAKNIQGASKMLLALINDILDMSKIESGKMEIVPVNYDVGDMLSDVVNMIWIRAREKGLQFHIDVEQSMPAKLHGDEVRIKQILINVLNNAVKYTKEGSVTLTIQCKRMENGLAYITYSVTDTGIGIKKESVPYLFSAFKRVDEENNRYIEGTGLGLSIVKQLVELMDGEIAVNSVYTKGSTFVITIPQVVVSDARIGNIDLETRQTLHTRERYKHSFEAPKARVLIVDDNETNLLVEEKLLRDTKVQIDTANSGASCLKKTLGTKYDVIFMDHLMPEMDGIECLHEIRKQVGGLNRNTQVVVLTANAGSEERSRYRREGFDGYLLKPVSGMDLEMELLRHLSQELVTVSHRMNAAGDMETPVLEHKGKKMIMITTESVCDLPQEFIQKHQIPIIPYRVRTEGGEFMDGYETETDGILSYIERKGKRVTSENPDVEDYELFFAEQLTKAQSVIHISMAKYVGHGYNQAEEAARSFDNVTVIDSAHLSSGMGLMVMRALECVTEDMSVEEIVAELEQMRGKIKTSFIVNSTEYLARVGRISAKVDRLCTAFMIHPVIRLKNSSMNVGMIRIGTKEHARRQYIHKLMKAMKRADRKVLYITYAGLSMEELQDIEREIAAKCRFEEVIYQKASPAISANCGPGSFGLIFAVR